MITTLLLTVIFGFANWLLATFFPSGGFSSETLTALSSFFGSVNQFNSIFPVDTALTVIKLTLGFWALVFLWRAALWGIHLIRGN